MLAASMARFSVHENQLQKLMEEADGSMVNKNPLNKAKFVICNADDVMEDYFVKPDDLPTQYELNVRKARLHREMMLER